MSVVRVARPDVLDALALPGHAVIEASAGTGKTYTLEHLVVELVLVHQVPLEQILVVTFTDKATREMRERVRAKLRAILDARESDERAASTWAIDDAARRRLGDALAVFDRAPISTIHSFCQRVLTESAFDCARLLQQEQVESREVFGQAFRDELRVELAPGAPLRAVLERALSAWSLERIEASLYRWYVERGVPEPRFDREVAADALRKLPTRMELGPTGLATRLLTQAFKHPSPKKEVPERLRALAPVVEALRAGGSIYDALLSFWEWAQADAPSNQTSLAYVRDHVRKATTKTPALKPLSELLERLGQVASSPLHVLLAEMLPRVVARLTGRKSEKGHFDFDDMLRMLRDALRAEGGGALVDELRRRYRVALVDEFQDTDRVQWDIFRTIFFEDARDQMLIVIGDPKQAIYGFRNADVHTYHAARAEIADRGGRVVPLTVSYRSRAPVVTAINRVLEQGFFTGVNAYPHPVTCGRPELSALGPDGQPLPALTLLHFVGRPELKADRVRHALGEHIAREIQRLLAGASVVDPRGPRALSPADIHVLCRSRGDADDVGAALTAARIPHAFYKQEGLFQTAAARDVFVLLRALEDPDARVRRLDAWLTPFFAVPLEKLDECRDVAPEHPLVARLTHWRALAEAQEWAALFRSMLEESGLVRRELFVGASERRLTDYQHIAEILLEETHRGRRSLPELVTRLGAFIEGREVPVGESGNVHRLESERKAVQILTMHKSKGLEAEVVFLAGGLSEPSDDHLFPHVFHDADGRRIAWVGEPTEAVKERLRRERREEAERLLYVALTRARSALYVPYFGPPPPGADVHADASYELSVAPDASEARSQLRLVFDADAAVDEPATDGEYELKRLNGPYRVLNERLVQLVSAGVTSEPELFARVEIPVVARRDAALDARLVLSGFDPPAELVAHDDVDRTRFARLRRRHAGFDVTSYTRMKSALGGYRGAEGDEEPREAFVTEAVDAALPAAEEEDELPGGTGIGVFLHEVLEHLPFERVLALPDGDALLAQEDLRALLDRHARANGIAVELLPAAARLLVSALRAPFALADGSRLEHGLCAVTRRAAEVPFLHPIPERAHPALDQPPPGPDRPPLTIERGYVRGVIDLVIEHEGRYHVLDYKSDRLPSYAPDALRHHVERNYLVQARLYTLGTLRILSIHDAESYDRRFGGLAYAFLRRMGAEGQGLWTFRPSWDEVLGWERTLHDDAPWGYPLPPRRARLAGA